MLCIPRWEALNFFYPVGAQYSMFAVAASNDPDVAFPCRRTTLDALFGGTGGLALWDGESVAFRTEGTLSRMNGRAWMGSKTRMQGCLQACRGCFC